MHGKEFFMKHNKLFAMLAVAAALAVSACGGNGDNPSSSAHKHSAAPDAPWQHDNNNHWKDCAANDGGKAENAKHTFGDPTDVVPATCTATGSQKVKCTVCGAEVTQTLPMIDHTWGEWEVTAEADCTNAGSRKHTCSVCGTEETETIPANGHTFGEWETVKEATCDKDGSRKHTCSVCGAEETETVEALGHDLELVGGETPAPDGEATVRLYRCKRCGETSLGFSADEPSEASKPHLMKGDNDGMRFFGRPIGNAMALTADGTSVNQQNNECVYCSTETGDFFEYVFTLNADQAATLASARLYCDARPANYLSGDFWAYNRSADDWTPGYYIDGADDHVQKDATTGEVVMVKDHAQATKNEDGSWTEGVELDTQVKMGARIEDYRYILYVDGNPVDFDAETSVPVKGSQQNMTRAEYVLPYTFHLHEGKNTISLRMAGGYRSEFYNFIFRPYVAPTPVTVNEANLEIREGKTAQITSTMEGLTYASANNQIATVDANGLVTGVKAGETTITVSKEGNYKDAKVAVKVLEKEGIVTLDIATGVIAPEGGFDPYTSGSSGFWLRNPKKDATLTLPAFGYNVTKLKVYGYSSAGEKVTFNVFVGDDAVSTEVTSSKVDHEFVIAANKQAVGTIYTIKVTNANNCQISKIEVFGNGCEAGLVQSYGWATYIPTVDVEYPANTAYVVTDASVNDGLTLAAVTQVPAGTPLLLKGAGAKTATVIASASDPTTNLLSVCNGTIDDGKYAYVLAKNGTGACFKQWTGLAATLNGRVVLLLDKAAAARGIFELDDDATGIKQVETSKQNAEGFYNLAGQRIANPTKGLYIVNGKKVIIK